MAAVPGEVDTDASPATVRRDKPVRHGQANGEHKGKSKGK
jgi:hypothetical protein